MSEDNSMGEAAESADHPMNFLLSENYNIGFPLAGEIRQGQVVAHRNNEILIDIGAKSEGIIRGSEIEGLSAANREALSVGTWVPVYVVDPEDRNGNTILSYSKVIEEEDWQRAQQLLESKEVYSGEVVGYNKGGLLMLLGMLRGFVPASQLSTSRRSGTARSAGAERLRQYVGEQIMVKVIEVDRSRNRLILSERAATKEIRQAERAHLLEGLQEGQTKEGQVVNLADFGAFVDIGGTEGLVHVSELSWKRVNHPAELLDVGDQVEVYVLRVDPERGRVALSLKRLEPDPWTLVEEIYHEGQLVEATITKLTRYGAFARVNDEYELEGLIHISELSETRVEHPQDVVESEQVVAARVIRVDSKKRQLGLSLKQVVSDRFLEADLAVAETVDTD